MVCFPQGKALPTQEISTSVTRDSGSLVGVDFMVIELAVCVVLKVVAVAANLILVVVISN